MKKVLQINLGGIPFTVDDDAYVQLEKYLNAVDKSFRHLDGHDDILQDIENRIAELIQEQIKHRQIVTLADVEAMMNIMGKPEDFQEETQANRSQRAFSGADHDKFEFRPGKRLFRDKENKVVGGVCAGLAAYFGIADPVWVRLIMVLFAMTFGSGVLFYFIMMIIVPEAKTAADKLAMRGEPANINNIANAIEKEFQSISDKINEISEDWKSKKK